MTIRTVTLLALSVAIIVVTWSVNDLEHGALFTQNGSALGQLGANLRLAMEEHYTNTGMYPKTLAELQVDAIHADGGNQSDIDHATFITEGPLAIVILERLKGPGLLLTFRNGKSTNVKYLCANYYP